MLIVDAHVHIWAQNTPNPSHRQVSSLSAEEMLKEMDAAGVIAAVIQRQAGISPRTRLPQRVPKNTPVALPYSAVFRSNV